MRCTSKLKAWLVEYATEFTRIPWNLIILDMQRIYLSFGACEVSEKNDSIITLSALSMSARLTGTRPLSRVSASCAFVCSNLSSSLPTALVREAEIFYLPSYYIGLRHKH